jgi:hypothetical protein
MCFFFNHVHIHSQTVDLQVVVDSSTAMFVKDGHDKTPINGKMATQRLSMSTTLDSESLTLMTSSLLCAR